MNEEYIVWSDGARTKDINAFPQPLYRQAEMDFVNEVNRKSIKRLYFKDECMLAITKNGELLKKGLFRWEYSYVKKNDTPTDRKEEDFHVVQFPQGETIKAIKFGDNHVLLLSDHGHLFSWGDNYYGQLGINNMMIPVRFDPIQVKMQNFNPVFTKIYAYRNNSFAIDNNEKLYIWGKSDFLMKKFRANLFKPTIFLEEYKLKGLKQKGNRLFVWGTNQGASDKANIFQITPTPDKFTLGMDATPRDQTIGEDRTPNIGFKIIPPTSKNIIPQPELPDSKGASAEKTDGKSLLKDALEFNSTVKNFIESFKDDDESMKEIREKVLSDTITIKSNGLLSYWDIISQTLTKAHDCDKQQLVSKKKRTEPTIKDHHDVFSSFFNIILCKSYDELKMNHFADGLSNLEKECLEKIKKLSEMKENQSQLGEMDVSMELISNMKLLLNYFIKYKKLEALIHKMAGHQFLLKSYQFENVKSALEQILKEKCPYIESKLYLIEKFFGTLDGLIERTDNSMQSLENIYGSYHLRMCKGNEPNISERFMYKYIIESTVYIRDLWKLLMSHISNESKLAAKETQMKKILEIYKELCSLQIYMSEIKLSGQGMNFEACSSQLTEIDGCIARLEQILNEKMDKAQPKQDMLTNELIVMYASSLLESAYMKKMLFSVIYSMNIKNKK